MLAAESRVFITSGAAASGTGSETSEDSGSSGVRMLIISAHLPDASAYSLNKSEVGGKYREGCLEYGNAQVFPVEGFDTADGQRRLQIDEFHDFAVPVCFRCLKHGIAEPEHNLALGKGCIGSAFQEFVIEINKSAAATGDGFGERVSVRNWNA